MRLPLGMVGGVVRPERIKFTPALFKATFRVGDSLEGFSTDLRLQITAIGEKRFFAKDHRGKERALTMANVQGWTKVVSAFDPKFRVDVITEGKMLWPENSPTHTSCRVDYLTEKELLEKHPGYARWKKING